MNKIIKNYVWKDRDLLMPTLVKGSYTYLEKDNRPLHALQIKLPFWVLDCSLKHVTDYKVHAPQGKWRERAINTLHLYPADCLFWEKKRSHKTRHCTGVLFKHGELAGLNKLIDPDYNYMRILDPKQKIIRYLIEIAEIGHQNQERGFWDAQILLFKIISLLHHCEPQDEATFTIPSEKALDTLSLSEKVDSFLMAHLAKPVTREILAAKLYISVSSLAHIYKMQTGMSPMKRLMQFRIDLAENMLQQGESLSTIAESTGFSSPFHLSLMFKRTLGITPRDYRQKLKG
jgi:AraC-like DNA-binding protein